jgi:Rrf2 family nitric oxide-sensitive transcriptional repressor
MMYLAVKYPGGSVATIEEIANAYDISRTHLMKIVNELGQSGLIETVRGRTGGARLARPPREISIGAVVRMAEKDFFVVPCHDTSQDAHCAILPACNLKRGMRRAMEAFMHELDKMTLQDSITTPTVAVSLLGIGKS